MSNERAQNESAGFYACERCGYPVTADRAFALMETLEVLCSKCFQKMLRPCESCRQLVGSAAYQHLNAGLLCEACVMKELLPDAPEAVT